VSLGLTLGWRVRLRARVRVRVIGSGHGGCDKVADPVASGEVVKRSVMKVQRFV